MQPDNLTLAYLAGVVDSDGYITIHRSKHREVLYHAARVGISGTSREPHDLASSLWGGKVAIYFPKNEQHRAQYQWSRTGVVAAEIIKTLQPFLRVKSQHAILALELQDAVGQRRSVGDRELLRDAILELMTRRGVRAA